MKKVIFTILTVISISNFVSTKKVSCLGSFPIRIDSTQFLQNPRSFVNFCNLLKETKIEYVLSNRKLIGSPRTILAPTDEAFRQFGLIGIIKKEKNKDELLKQLVNHHIIKQEVSTVKIKKNLSHTSYQTEAKTRIYLKDIQLSILYTVETETAIIHVVNKVFVPKTFERNYTLKKFIRK